MIGQFRPEDWGIVDRLKENKGHGEEPVELAWRLGLGIIPSRPGLLRGALF
jgi:hypothetical protein